MEEVRDGALRGREDLLLAPDSHHMGVERTRLGWGWGMGNVPGAGDNPVDRIFASGWRHRAVSEPGSRQGCPQDLIRSDLSRVGRPSQADSHSGSAIGCQQQQVAFVLEPSLQAESGCREGVLRQPSHRAGRQWPCPTPLLGTRECPTLSAQDACSSWERGDISESSSLEEPVVSWSGQVPFVAEQPH